MDIYQSDDYKYLCIIIYHKKYGTHSPSPYGHHSPYSLGMVKESDILKKFGNRVKNLRLQKGITSQMDLSFKTGMDRTYIGGIERGERNVALKNIEKLAGALGIKIEDLFKF